jgi:hypothetical protein
MPQMITNAEDQYHEDRNQEWAKTRRSITSSSTTFQWLIEVVSRVGTIVVVRPNRYSAIIEFSRAMRVNSSWLSYVANSCGEHI